MDERKNPEGGQSMPTDTNPYLLQLVTSLHLSCMIQLGKVANPASGKIERYLDQATYTIELLKALRLKMEGNLSEEEMKIIDNIIFETQMNYVDEVKKDNTKQANTNDADKSGMEKAEDIQS